MKHCDFCKIDIEDKKIHCPLCGKCLDDEKAKSGIVNHSAIYPDYQYKSNKKNLICKIITRSLLVLTLLSIIVDLLLNYTISFSLIVVIGYVYAYLVILKPIRRNMPIENFTIQFSLFTPLLLLFIELYTKTYGWGINITVPSLFIGISLFCFIFLISTHFKNFDMLKPIIICLALDALLLILLFIFAQPTLMTIISFLFNLGLVLFLLIFKFRTATKSITKEFRF